MTRCSPPAAHRLPERVWRVWTKRTPQYIASQYLCLQECFTHTPSQRRLRANVLRRALASYFN